MLKLMAGAMKSIKSHKIYGSARGLVMTRLLKCLDCLMLALVDCLLAFAGRRRVLLGEWPNGDVLNPALATLKELGSETIGAEG